MTKRHRLFILIAGGASALALGFWAVQARKPPTWVEPLAYVYSVRFSCGMALPPGQYTLTVDHGKVSKVVADNAYSEKVLQVRKLTPTSFPTLGTLFKEFRRAWDEGADVADVDFDPVDGHPTTIQLDYDRQAQDDESCSDIVRFAAS